jgi:transmembrane sensor
MIHDHSRLQYLLSRYTANNCTRKELLEFFTMIKDAGDDESLNQLLEPVWQSISDTDKIPDLDRDKIFKNITAGNHVIPMQSPRRWMRYAAAALLLASGAVGFYYYNTKASSKISSSYANKAPTKQDRNKATLTLADGTLMPLNNKVGGVIVTQNEVPVKQVANGEIIYQSNSAKLPKEQTYNTLATPLGGQFAITLADGTKVWLNAMSSLKYPVTFVGNERRVELTGEGYFEVAKNKHMPFIVTVNNSEVKVFGTHFNIMGYISEHTTGITLLEGSVSVSADGRSQMLLPGQLASVKDHQITISATDGSQAVAWKNGYFNFGHEKIEVIMRKLSRWFNIDVTYQGKITREGFVGAIPQTTELAEILKTLELTGLVHFKVNGRSVIVMP